MAKIKQASLIRESVDKNFDLEHKIPFHLSGKFTEAVLMKQNWYEAATMIHSLKTQREARSYFSDNALKILLVQVSCIFPSAFEKAHPIAALGQPRHSQPESVPGDGITTRIRLPRAPDKDILITLVVGQQAIRIGRFPSG